MNMVDLIAVAALTVQEALEAPGFKLTAPGYVSIGHGLINLQMASREEVQAWGLYFAADEPDKTTAYRYHESNVPKTETSGMVKRMGFAEASWQGSHWIGDHEEAFTVSVYYNEQVI